MWSLRLPAIVFLAFLVGHGAPAAAAKSSDPDSLPAIEVRKGLQSQMRRARAAGDWNAYLAAAKRQEALLNASPRSRLEVARAETQLKDPGAALSELRGFVHMGQSFDESDPMTDLEPLRPLPAYATIRDEAADNRRPIARASLAFALKDHGLVPEDIDHDPRTERFFISSVLQKKIVTVTMQGELSDFAASPDGWPILALKIDHARQLLWASEVAIEGFEGIEASAQGRSAILCYELRTGKLLRRIEAASRGALGDIALAADGTVIASDGDHGGIYRVPAATDRMERIDAGDFIAPQTVALSADGDHLIVPDYLRGLGILEIHTRRVEWLSTRGKFALNGIDGLYRAGRRLIAVQNGTNPERVVIFLLDPTGTKVVSEDIVERSTATLGDPTHGVIVGDSFYYIANSGWDVLDDHGKVKPGMSLPEPRVMRAALGAR